jgi:ribosomal-protein-alanine N-acetyltransferase
MPRTTARLRAMRWTDIADAHALEAHLFPHDAWSVETFWSELAQAASRCYVVVIDDDDALLGYAGVMTVGADADVQTVAVAPLAQGRGIGRLLLHSLLATARDRGCTRCFLEVRSDNAAAIALYERHGFTRTGVRRGYYAPGVDAMTYQADLRRGAVTA